MEDFNRHHHRTRPSARTLRLDLPTFTLVGATTRAGLIASPCATASAFITLRTLSGGRTRYHRPRSADILKVKIEPEGSLEIAASRGTPRIANRMLKRVRDYARFAPTHHHRDVADACPENVGSDSLGSMSSTGGPPRHHRSSRAAGRLRTMAAMLGEERDTIEDSMSLISPTGLPEPYQSRATRHPRRLRSSRHSYVTRTTPRDDPNDNGQGKLL